MLEHCGVVELAVVKSAAEVTQSLVVAEVRVAALQMQALEHLFTTEMVETEGRLVLPQRVEVLAGQDQM